MGANILVAAMAAAIGTVIGVAVRYLSLHSSVTMIKLSFIDWLTNRHDAILWGILGGYPGGRVELNAQVATPSIRCFRIDVLKVKPYGMRRRLGARSPINSANSRRCLRIFDIYPGFRRSRAIGRVQFL